MQFVAKNSTQRLQLAAVAVALFLPIEPRIRAESLVDVSLSPHAVVAPVGLRDVRWTEGFWAERFAICRDRSIPAMWEIMHGEQYKPYLKHFLIAAGDVPGEYHGAPFNDGDFYKFLEAACAMLAQTDNPELTQIVNRSIDAIGRAQASNGYLHTPVLVARINGDRDARPFQDRHNFEMYNLGHLLTAACIHYRTTGDDRFLNIARRTADFLCNAFEHPTPELAQNSVCPSHYMGMVELYRTTRDPRYLNLAQSFLDMRTLVKNGGDDNQDRVPFYDQREAVGHAVRANYLYAGAADLYLESGDARLRAPLTAVWNSVVQKKIYITGACGALYDGASPYGSPNQSSITRVHQAYGSNYELPNTTGHGETCAAVGGVLWNWRMFLATGEACYLDVLERTLYNAVLSGVSLEGTDYFYVNPLRNTNPLPTELRWSRTRVPFVTSFCCPPNVLRTLAEAQGYFYCRTEDALWINLYGGNSCETSLGGHPLKLTQTTDYPWDGRVEVTIEECPATEFSLRLRIPGWADTARLYVNGEAVDVSVEPNTYAEVRRDWSPGDVLVLDLAMPARLVEAHPLVEATRNQTAVQRGPLVYCLESPDLPEGIRVHEVVVPADVKLTPRHDGELLGGVTVVDADVLARPTGDWENRLYRPRVNDQESEIHVSFIPYYAWANRGKSEMTVWLPVK